MTYPDPPRGIFRGTNFMTPDVIAYFKLRHGLGWAELTSGTGIEHEPIFGVTVRDYMGEDPGRNTPGGNLSKMFFSEREAREYIKSLQ